ncbi:hypothetical protein [Acidovorax sp. SDU_ACID1]|uniref:hypothetical protein n=1 Tax=Acidovorax sp. SDU_ACID1 TaxID=3136632 RepID=UPI003873173A
MKMPWFRAYTKMVDDEKLRLLAFEDRWHFVAILCLKGAGVLDENDPLLMRKVAVKLGLDLRALDEAVRRIAEVGLIDRETLQPIKWDELQMRSDADTTAAERKRRQRQRQREASHSSTDPDPGDGENRDTEVSRVTGTDVTRTDTDTDKEEDIAVSLDVVGAPPAAAAPPAAPPTPAPKPRRAEPVGTRLPADWALPKPWGEWALAERPDMAADDVRREAACFADHWHAKAGKDGRKADWLATWRNWIRRCDGGAPRTARGGRAGVFDPHAQVETFAQRAARQRMEEVAPMAARKAPGGGFDAAQRFMRGGDVVDVTPAAQGRDLALAGGAHG